MSFSTRLLAALVTVSMGTTAFAQDTQNAATAPAAEAKAADTSAASGKKAADFKLKDADGKEHSLADYKGKMVVLEWTNPGCPFVVRHTKQGTTKKLNAKWKDKDVVFLQVNSNAGATAEDVKKAAEAAGHGVSVLLDPEGTAGQAYGAKTTPHVFVIDKEGNIVYQGAYDDDESGEKGDAAKNYVDAALTSLSSGGKVEVAQTKSYGCGVKYKK